MDIKKFIIYNNAVPITLGVLFLSSGLVFAANEEARQFVADSVYQAQQRVVSVDNSYIANKNLDLYSPKVSINDVTEDDEYYYISYTFTTIALEDHVWQDVEQQRTMQVAKTALGDYTDLGVYVTEQLKQVVARELQHLREVQAIERRQVSNKVVATAYSGLIGQFIDESTEQLPGYTPRVVQPQSGDIDPVAIAKAEKSDAIPFDFEAAQREALSKGNNGGGSSNDSGPVISILGANPARVSIGSTYSDLGIVTTTQEGVTLDLSVQLYVNGVEVNEVSIDTTEAADWSVGYSVTYEGETTNAERVVIVFDPNAVEEDEDTATSTATTTETTSATTTGETTTPENTTQESDTTQTSQEDDQTQQSATTTGQEAPVEETTPSEEEPPAEETQPEEESATETATSTES